MKIKYFKKAATAIVVSLFLQGCTASTSGFMKTRNADGLVVEKGMIQIGKTNPTRFSGLQMDIEKFIAIQSYQELTYQTQYLESLIEQYASDDGRFEQAVYCALAISYLEQGKRDDFIRSVQQLSSYMKEDTYLSPEVQFVMEIYQVMSKTQSNKGISRDPKMQQVIRDLLIL